MQVALWENGQQNLISNVKEVTGWAGNMCVVCYQGGYLDTIKVSKDDNFKRYYIHVNDLTISCERIDYTIRLSYND